MDTWLNYHKLDMDSVIEEEVAGNFKLQQFRASDTYMVELHKTIDNLRKWREEKDKK